MKYKALTNEAAKHMQIIRLTPELEAELAVVANIAERLAETVCVASVGEDITPCLDNLDAVASAITIEDLEDAPAQLMGVARAFRQIFPANSQGWEEAATLTWLAMKIDGELAAWFAPMSWEDGIKAYRRRRDELDALRPIIHRTPSGVVVEYPSNNVSKN